MKKDFTMSIVLHLFLGCLFISFGLTVVRLGIPYLTKSLILLASTYPLIKISDRVTPFKSYKMNHPFKIAETISMFVIPFAYLIMMWT